MPSLFLCRKTDRALQIDRLVLKCRIGKCSLTGFAVIHNGVVESKPQKERNE